MPACKLQRFMSSAVILFILSFSACAFAQAGAAENAASAAGELPLTTTSPEARSLVGTAWKLDLDEVEQTESIEILRTAVKIDPDFAMAHEILAQVSLDSAEQVNEQAKAFATRKHASLPEQQVIEWYQAASDHDVISAITKMNAVLNQYPHDKWVVWMTTWWLMNQNQFERAAEVFERSGITDSPGLINNMGYNYASMRQFDKAFDMMEQYVAAMPHNSNPQDSYAEILRMAGHFNQAVEHYKASLAINPNFYSSQFGLADTYSLMGDQARARQEYETGFSKFRLPEQHWTLWRTREAMTYVREGDYAGADRAFQAIAEYAHARHASQIEADTYRLMAMYQKQPQRALVLLRKAEIAAHQAKNAMRAGIMQEQAQILRARVELGIRTNDKQMIQSSLAALTAMAENSNDKLIELAWHGAAGAALSSEHKYAQAIPHLEEDANNPLSLQLLVMAYQKTADAEAARRATDTLLNLNDPSLEQALVVPPFRKCSADPSCNTGMRNASFSTHHP